MWSSSRVPSTALPSESHPALEAGHKNQPGATCCRQWGPDASVRAEPNVPRKPETSLAWLLLLRCNHCCRVPRLLVRGIEMQLQLASTG